MFITERWINSVVDVVRVGLSAEENDDFWHTFIIVLSGIPKQDSIFIGSDLNGHAGRDANGYGGVHGGMGFGTRNSECESTLEFGDAVDMAVAAHSSRDGDSKLITQPSGDNRSMIDYLIVRKIDPYLIV